MFNLLRKKTNKQLNLRNIKRNKKTCVKWQNSWKKSFFSSLNLSAKKKAWFWQKFLCVSFKFKKQSVLKIWFKFKKKVCMCLLQIFFIKQKNFKKIKFCPK